jgi:hypothetical protein
MFLKIQNPGVADPLGFVLIGASTTSSTGGIGMFGSGGKYAIAMLLRNQLRPIVCAGNHTMEFFAVPQSVGGHPFSRVCVRHSGTKKSTEQLGFTTEWGTKDWTSLDMALREFVANAIDGAKAAGKGPEEVVIEVVEKARAKKGYTTVYIPYEREVERAMEDLRTRFLHFARPELLGKKILPKQEKGPVRIYKDGVRIWTGSGPDSVFDYQLDVPLDESRNANQWECSVHAAFALCDASKDEIKHLLTCLSQDSQLWEGSLDQDYMAGLYRALPESVLQERKKTWSEAWKEAFPDIVPVGSAGKNGSAKHHGDAEARVGGRRAHRGDRNGLRVGVEGDRAGRATGGWHGVPQSEGVSANPLPRSAGKRTML